MPPCDRVYHLPHADGEQADPLTGQILHQPAQTRQVGHAQGGEAIGEEDDVVHPPFGKALAEGLLQGCLVVGRAKSPLPLTKSMAASRFSGLATTGASAKAGAEGGQDLVEVTLELLGPLFPAPSA